MTGFVLNMTRFGLKMTGFVLNMTGFILSMTGFVINMIGFVLNMTVFVLKKTGFEKYGGKTDLTRNSFKYRAQKYYSSILASMKNMSLQAFKTRLKKFTAENIPLR